MLLARGRAVSDEQLGDRLWGERPPTTASAQIYTYLSRLRKSFGSTLTISRLSTGYQMPIDHLYLDLTEFDKLATAGAAALAEARYTDAASQLRRALSLWQGEALAGATEHLIDAERPRLEELRLTALESRIEADLALGRHQQITAELTGLVVTHPLRERLRAQLMTALVRCDRQADATKSFHEGRRLLRDEYGVEPGSALKATYQDMLTGVLAMPRPRSDSRAGAATLAMLPRNLPDFVGRRAERSVIATALATKRDRPVVITGPLGIGKTALAVNAAHAYADQFPDAQLYAEMHTPSGQPVSLEAIVGRFLQALGVPGDSLPTGLGARVELYRSLVETRRVLVVADDVETVEQAECLVPPGPLSAAIVTTQNREAVPACAQVIALELLDRSESMELLTKIVGEVRMVAERSAVAKVVDCCGGLPLALRILGSRFVRSRRFNVVDLAERLNYA